jgi:hypothetical protein
MLLIKELTKVEKGSREGLGRPTLLPKSMKKSFMRNLAR